MPRFSFRMIRLLVWYVHCKNTNFFYIAWIYIFLLEHAKILKKLHSTTIQNVCFIQIFGITDVWSMFRLLQVVLFLTDSVFDAFFCTFWWNYRLYRWYRPWKSYITLHTMQKQNMNWLETILKVVICFIITNGFHEGFLKFCVIEVFKFWAGSRWMKE